MTAPRPSAAHASVVALKLRDFAHKAVSEQAMLKGKLDRAVTVALAALSPDERIVLDSPGGAALVVLGNPRGALEFAQRAANTPGLAAGIHHGPVRVIDSGEESVLVGDGITAAHAIADLAPHGRLVAAREFRDAVRAAAPDLAQLFSPAGRFTDAQDRSHELFFADAAAFTTRRREFLLSNVLLFAAIAGAGVVGRIAVHRWRLAPGTIVFEVKPWADIYIDGTLKGRSPPLARVALSAGTHNVELYHPRFKTFVQEVSVDAGETLVIRHGFAMPAAPSAQQQPKPAWRRFLDKIK